MIDEKALKIASEALHNHECEKENFLTDYSECKDCLENTRLVIEEYEKSKANNE